MTRAAPAKINLGLHVLRRRPDGYHDVETVLLRLPWHDRLTATPAEAFAFTCSDAALPTDGGNLCVRAARALLAAAGAPARGAALHLDKHLPYGAGLGGGSSDAAATLRLLNALWNLDVPEKRLYEIAAGLGADVSFFLGAPAALATARGDELVPLQGADGQPYRLPFPVVVVVPPVEVSTAAAYGLVTPRAEGRPDLAALVRSNDLGRWAAALRNDFQAPVEALHPAIRLAREALLDAGAGYAALSGSGSAVYGVFESDDLALAATEAARRAGHRVWHGVAEDA